MNAYAVVNPLLEAIYYFKMKANGETQAQVLDRVLKKRITTAGEITDFFGPAFELENFLMRALFCPNEFRSFSAILNSRTGATPQAPALQYSSF